MDCGRQSLRNRKTFCNRILPGDNYIPVLMLMLVAVSAFAERNYGGYYTEERIANLRRNCEIYDWARQQRAKVIAAAKGFFEKSDEELWHMVQGQDMPRCIDVTMDRSITKGPKRLGCLQCGDKIFNYGNYPYDPDFEKKPWKLTCPSCGAVFPTNDFGKYYESAIDEHGLFNPARGDRSLLFNAEHPDSNDPLHFFGVDDGFGYIDANGRSHKFIGYYMWKNWGRIQAGTAALAKAYLYTGNKAYARKAAILLDRLADVYPSMDWSPYARRGWYHSDGNRSFGKIGGCIWECGVASVYADNYEMILSGTNDNPELYDFLKRMSERYQLPRPKGTRDLLVQNIDDNLLRCAWAGVQSGQISGNEGMHQRTIATIAIALDTEPETTQWLDWLFVPNGGAIPGLFVGSFDRDGLGPEGAPGYSVLWGGAFAGVADRLAVYTRYKKGNFYRDYANFRASVTAGWRLAALGVATPNAGDTGATGLVSRPGLNLNLMVEGYRHTKDPEIAVHAWRANGNSAQKLGRDIFSSSPDALSKEIEELGRKAGPRPPRGCELTGFGLATLEIGSGSSAKALCCSYGRTSHHGHFDQLNFDLFGYGTWLAPDHGYPEFATAWPTRDAWTNNTISHNTVIVDQEPQQENWGGHTRYYKQLRGFGAFEISCPRAYPSIKEYARTMMFIETPDNNAYTVDLFRVVGGKDHLYSFHGVPGSVDSRGLQLTVQKEGTYAGENVAFQTMSESVPLGYSFLYNVRRDPQPPSCFVLDWKTESNYRGLTDKDNVHVRLYSLTTCDDIALAEGDPPQNKLGNPRRLTYALLHRRGESLASTFVSVIESYREQPSLRSVERLEVSGFAASDQQGAPTDTQVALRVELVGGQVDYILWSASEKPLRFADDGSFCGSIGFLRLSNEDRVTSAVLIQGSELRYKDVNLKSRPAFMGKVMKRSQEVNGGGWILVDTQLPIDGSLTGQQIVVENDNERDACYEIKGVEKEDDLFRIDCGQISFVRGFRSERMNLRGHSLPQDYTSGYLYDFEEGAPFRIPVDVSWPR